MRVALTATVLLAQAASPLRLNVEHVAVLRTAEQLVSAAVGKHGTICTVWYPSSIVRCYEADGRLRWETGGKEAALFSLPLRVAVTDDDTVLVYDRERQTITWLSPLGVVNRTAMLPVQFATVDDVVALPGDELAISGIVLDPPRSAQSGIHIFSETLSYLRAFAPIPKSVSVFVQQTWGAGGLSLDRRGNLIYVLKLPFEVMVYSSRGVSQRSFRLPLLDGITADVHVKTTRQAGVTQYTAAGPLAARPLKAFHVSDSTYIGAHIADRHLFWDLFSDTGRLISTVAVDSSWLIRAGYDATAQKMIVFAVREGGFDLLSVKPVYSLRSR